jgi:TonB family protein
MTSSFMPTTTVSRRALAAGAILVLHLLVAYLFVTGLIPAVTHEIQPHITGVFLPQPPPTHQPPPLVTLGTPAPPSIPDPGVPQLHMDQSVPAPPADFTIPAPGTAGTAAGGVPIRVLGHNLLPDSESYYPPDLRRLGVQGATAVRACVDAGGQRIGEPQIEQSSGNARLDSGALNVVRHGRFARSVQGDTPVPNCFDFRIVFRLRY